MRLVDSTISTKGIWIRSIETHLKFWTICWIVACPETIVQIECFVKYFVQFPIGCLIFFRWFCHCLFHRFADWINCYQNTAKKKLVRETNVSNFKGWRKTIFVDWQHKQNKISPIGKFRFYSNVKIQIWMENNRFLINKIVSEY